MFFSPHFKILFSSVRAKFYTQPESAKEAIKTRVTHSGINLPLTHCPADNFAVKTISRMKEDLSFIKVFVCTIYLPIF